MPTLGGPTRATCAAPSRRTAIESRWTARRAGPRVLDLRQQGLAEVRVRPVPVVGQLREQRADLADPLPPLLADQPALRHLRERAMRHRHRHLLRLRGGRHDLARCSAPATATCVTSRPFLRRWVRKGPISLSGRRSSRTRRSRPNAALRAMRVPWAHPWREPSAQARAWEPPGDTDRGRAFVRLAPGRDVAAIALHSPRDSRPRATHRPPRGPPPARGHGRRRVPRRPRADGHGGRAARDRRRRRRTGRASARRRGSSTATCWSRSSRCPSPAASPTCGARGALFLWALVVFTVGSLLAGMAPTLEVLIAARLVQAVGGGALVPVATSAASHLFTGGSAGRGRSGLIGGPDVPGHGRRPVPRRGDPGRGPPGGGAVAARRRVRVVPRQRHRARLALGVLRQRPDRDRGRRRRLGREQRLGDAAPTGSPRHRRRRSCSRPSSWVRSVR